VKDLALHILDIIQNSIRAEATLIELLILENDTKNRYDIQIIDNGKGMSEELVKQVIDPFFTTRTTRKIGLGISLFKQNAEQTGGSLELESKLGKGTCLKVNFVKDNIDRQPLGDIIGVITLVVSANPDIEFIYTHQTDKGKYIFDTREIKQVLDGVPIANAEVIGYLKEMLNGNLEEIQITK